MRRALLLAVTVLAGTAHAAPTVTPATLGYCVAIGEHMAEVLRHDGRTAIAAHLDAANQHLRGLLVSAEQRAAFQRSFHAAMPERIPSRHLPRKIALCSHALAPAGAG